jgi:branched-chain amino acid transport system ATP-binding protein
MTEAAVTSSAADESIAPLLEVDDLVVSYGPIRAIERVALTVRAGEIVTVLGSNGAGKTTLLKAIMGLIPISSGSVRFEAEEISGVPTERLVRKRLTLTPEGRQVFAALSVDENLRMGAVGAAEGSWTDRRAEMFELFPILSERRKQLAGLLSGGEQQQLAIARSMMSDPTLLLLDEPSLGLAPQIVDRMFDLIAQLRDRGTTILLVEQNTERALDIADRGYVLQNGSVALSGAAAELAESAEVREAYLGKEY